MSIPSLKGRIITIDTSKAAPIAVQRIRGWKLTKIRQRILLRDCYTCMQCGRVSVDLQVDHIEPLHTGGADSDANRQAICVDCHNAKSEREEKGRGGSNLHSF